MKSFCCPGARVSQLIVQRRWQQMIAMMTSRMMKTLESGVKKYFQGEIALQHGKRIGVGGLTALPSHVGKSFQIKCDIGVGVKPHFL